MAKPIYISARWRQDLRVDANQLTRGIYQRAAGIALVDGGVSLQEILEAAVA
jgi:hypothetical protein